MLATASRLTIGDLSRSAGVKVETIRYYERIGLIPAPTRTRGGYRIYDAQDVERLFFIRRSRGLGFTLDDVRALLCLTDHPARARGDAHRIVSKHLSAVRNKIADLRRMERLLSKMVDRCNSSARGDCPILGVLSNCEASRRVTTYRRRAIPR
jgi:MerR family mercuric resistance operon transcriptional regulator